MKTSSYSRRFSSISGMSTQFQSILFLLILSVVTSLSSCVDNKEGYAERIVHQLHNDGINTEKYTHVVIIPESGCGGCISEAEHFFIEYKEQNIYFIFTKVYSEKLLRLRLGKLLDRANVYVDKYQSYITDKTEINIYPVIVDIRDKDELEWRFLEPGVSYQDILQTFGK